MSTHRYTSGLSYTEYESLPRYSSSYDFEPYSARNPVNARSVTRYDRIPAMTAYTAPAMLAYDSYAPIYGARSVIPTSPPISHNGRLSPSSVATSANGGGGDYVAELGRASWKVLHEIADRYPTVPTAQEQRAAMQFLEGFSILYPCEKCRLHFQEVMQKFPPDVSSQAAFSRWMSFFHDEVNAGIGKPKVATAATAPMPEPAMVPGIDDRPTTLF